MKCKNFKCDFQSIKGESDEVKFFYHSLKDIKIKNYDHLKFFLFDITSLCP